MGRATILVSVPVFCFGSNWLVGAQCVEIAWLQLWMQLRLVSGAHLVFVGTQDGRAESTGGILSSGGVLSGGLISGIAS